MKKRLSFILLVAGLIVLLGINGFTKEKKKENFRFKVLYQFNEVVSQGDFFPKDYDIWMFQGNFDYYFGDWSWYFWGKDMDWVQLGTYTKLNFKAGDAVPLHQMRRISKNKVGNPLGFELEGRIWKTVWLGAVYNQSPVFTSEIIEENEVMRFEDFEKVYADYSSSYWVYNMKLVRLATIQKISEKFYFRNFSLYTKGEVEISHGFLQMFGGAGVDLLQTNRKVEKEKTIYGFMPWTEKRISEKSDENSQKDTDWIIRPVMLVEIQARIVKGLSLGIQGKLLSQTKDLKYEKDFLLPLPDYQKFWTIIPSKQSISLFLTFNF